MYTNNRDSYRQAFFTAWAKQVKQLPLEPIEAQLVDVMLLHPEYQRFLDSPTSFQAQEFALEENPFMHMSLHLAVRDQVRMDHPKGITAIYQQLLLQQEKKHEAEHQIMHCLSTALWQAQQTGAMPSDEAYMSLLLEVVVK